MDIEFQDLKNRRKVKVPASSVKKIKYTRTTKNGKKQTRYAVKAELDGVKLNRFVSEDFWKKLDAPEI